MQKNTKSAISYLFLEVSVNLMKNISRNIVPEQRGICGTGIKPDLPAGLGTRAAGKLFWVQGPEVAEGSRRW